MLSMAESGGQVELAIQGRTEICNLIGFSGIQRVIRSHRMLELINQIKIHSSVKINVTKRIFC